LSCSERWDRSQRLTIRIAEEARPYDSSHFWSEDALDIGKIHVIRPPATKDPSPCPFKKISRNREDVARLALKPPSVAIGASIGANMQTRRSQIVDCAAEQSCPVRLDGRLSIPDHGCAIITQSIPARG